MVGTIATVTASTFHPYIDNPMNARHSMLVLSVIAFSALATLLIVQQAHILCGAHL